MNKTFSTAQAIATGIEWVGWTIVTLSLVGVLFTLNTGDTPQGAYKLTVIGGGVITSAVGFGLILTAQLVQAQVVTAINTGQILDHLAKLTPEQTTQTQLKPAMYGQNTAPSKHPLEKEGSTTNTEGRFLRKVKGYELHKFPDGISVNGEGRYPNIVAAEKRAAELASKEQST